MTYKELLAFCIKNPGCLQTKEQNEAESDMRYRMWLENENEEYLRSEK